MRGEDTQLMSRAIVAIKTRRYALNANIYKKDISDSGEQNLRCILNKLYNV